LGSSTDYTCTYTDTTVAARDPKSVVRYATPPFAQAATSGLSFSATAVMPPG
jgi:hypothetical protein